MARPRQITDLNYRQTEIDGIEDEPFAKKKPEVPDTPPKNVVKLVIELLEPGAHPRGTKEIYDELREAVEPFRD